MAAKIKDFRAEATYLKMMDFENFFDVYTDKRGNLVFNLNKSLYFFIDDGAIEQMQMTHNMHWPLASYKIYGTTRLAWLLMKINNVDAKNVFDIIHAGDVIKYLSREQLASVLDIINAESDY